MCVEDTSLYMFLGDLNAVAELLNADLVKVNQVDSKLASKI